MKLPRLDFQLALLFLAICFSWQPGKVSHAVFTLPQQDVAARPAEGQPPVPHGSPVPKSSSVPKPQPEPLNEELRSEVASAKETAADKAPTPDAQPAVTDVADPKVAESKSAEPKGAESIASAPTIGNAEVVSSDEIRTLSVAPTTKPMLPKDRPAWVGSAPDLSTSVHRLFVGSFPVSDRDDVDAGLDEPLMAAVSGYIDESILNNVGGHTHVTISPEFIRRNLIQDPAGYVAEMETSSGPVFQKWVVLEITPEQRKHFQQEYSQAEQRKRIGVLGAAVACLVGFTSLFNFGFRRRAKKATNFVAAVPPGTIAMVPVNAKSKSCCTKGGGFVWLLAGVLAIGTVGFVHERRTIRLHESQAELSRARAEMAAHRALAESKMSLEEIENRNSVVDEISKRVKDKASQIEEAAKRLEAKIKNRQRKD